MYLLDNSPRYLYGGLSEDISGAISPALTIYVGSIYSSSMSDIVEQRLQNTIAELEADLAQHQQQLDETQRAMGEIQEAIAELQAMLSGRDGDRRSLPVAVAPQPTETDSTSSQESSPAPNGSPEVPTRRQLVKQIVPQFHGEVFEARDVREKLLKQYMEAEPPNFPAALNNLLQKMAEVGDTIERVGKKGDKPRDPWLYREKPNQEESLSLEP